eukprot:3814013-Rhodomonas_salina.2
MRCMWRTSAQARWAAACAASGGRGAVGRGECADDDRQQRARGGGVALAAAARVQLARGLGGGGGRRALEVVGNRAARNGGG